MTRTSSRRSKSTNTLSRLVSTTWLSPDLFHTLHLAHENDKTWRKAERHIRDAERLLALCCEEFNKTDQDLPGCVPHLRSGPVAKRTTSPAFDPWHELLGSFMVYVKTILFTTIRNGLALLLYILWIPLLISIAALVL